MIARINSTTPQKKSYGQKTPAFKANIILEEMPNCTESLKVIGSNIMQHFIHTNDEFLLKGLSIKQKGKKIFIKVSDKFNDYVKDLVNELKTDYLENHIKVYHDIVE